MKKLWINLASCHIVNIFSLVTYILGASRIEISLLLFICIVAQVNHHVLFLLALLVLVFGHEGLIGRRLDCGRMLHN